MKGIDTLIRLARRHLDAQRRQVADLERLRDGLVASLRDIADDIARERAHAGGGGSFASAFPAFVAAALDRRATLARSLAEAEAAVAEARARLAERFEEVKRYEIAADRMRDRLHRAEARREQAALDEIGLVVHRRGG